MRQGVHVTHPRLVEKREKVRGCRRQMSSPSGDNRRTGHVAGGPGSQVGRGWGLCWGSGRLVFVTFTPSVT